MLALGLRSGVDLANKMKVCGYLQVMGVHFYHMHQEIGWSNIATHIYDPFVTIATCEIKVQNKHAQEDFW